MADLDVGLGFDVRVLDDSEKEIQKGVYLMGKKIRAPEFQFYPEYSVTEKRGEIVVSVLAGKTLGQRRFDHCAMSEARHMNEFAILITIRDVVAFEALRIATQEVVCND